jgi:UrcA family protein
MKIIRNLAAITAAAFAFTAVAAQAEVLQIEDGHLVKEVIFDKADLKTEQRAQTVYAMIRDVAAEVCAVDGDAPAWVLAEDEDCVNRAISGAVADLDNDNLRQVHQNARGMAQAYARNDR